LISTTGSFQPSKDIGIDPNRYAGFLGPIELAYDGIRRYFSDFRDIGKVNLAIRSGSEPFEFFPFLSR